METAPTQGISILTLSCQARVTFEKHPLYPGYLMAYNFVKARDSKKDDIVVDISPSNIYIQVNNLKR